MDTTRGRSQLDLRKNFLEGLPWEAAHSSSFSLHIGIECLLQAWHSLVAEDAAVSKKHKTVCLHGAALPMSKYCGRLSEVGHLEASWIVSLGGS